MISLPMPIMTGFLQGLYRLDNRLHAQPNGGATIRQARSPQ
ncbi:hypothetical protein C4J89_2161 [Pseudomonas sp. R4-35-07]|nr:hypothetical protein C4J89_2161 [Pseudomonas sp. R4-35-07]